LKGAFLKFFNGTTKEFEASFQIAFERSVRFSKHLKPKGILAVESFRKQNLFLEIPFSPKVLFYLKAGVVLAKILGLKTLVKQDRVFEGGFLKSTTTIVLSKILFKRLLL